MEEYLIKNTTREQREQIVKDSLGYSELGCDDAMDGYDMYLPYIEGIKELREITMEYQAQYVRDMEARGARALQSVLEMVPFFLQKTLKYNLEIIIRTRENMSELRRCSPRFFFQIPLKCEKR